jgi:hypothetical protein
MLRTPVDKSAACVRDPETQQVHAALLQDQLAFGRKDLGVGKDQGGLPATSKVKFTWLRNSSASAMMQRPAGNTVKAFKMLFFGSFALSMAAGNPVCKATSADDALSLHQSKHDT